MQVTVKLFAAARQAVGRDSVEVHVPEDATVADVKRTLGDTYSELATILPHSLMAIGTDYATDQTVVKPTSIVACIPPVSGG